MFPDAPDQAAIDEKKEAARKQAAFRRTYEGLLPRAPMKKGKP